MVSVETLRLLTHIGLALGLVALALVIYPFVRAIGRGAGPIVWGITLSCLTILASSVLYEWVLYHLHTWMARHANYFVLYFIILHQSIFIVMAIWILVRSRREQAP